MNTIPLPTLVRGDFELMTITASTKNFAELFASTAVSQQHCGQILIEWHARRTMRLALDGEAI